MAGRTRESERPDGVDQPFGSSLDLNAFEASALTAVRRWGTRGLVLRVSAGAVVSSMLITAGLMMVIFGPRSESMLPGIAMGTIVPALVAPPIVAVIARLMARLDETSQKLARAAITDPLTGIHNRRGFFEFFQLRASSQPMSVAMIDIDDFKAINDRFGHSAGDKVLRHLAVWLEEHAGDGGGVGRLGGDEFVMVAPSEVVERLEQRETFTRDGITFAATIGAAPVTGEGIDHALGVADAALYRHKAARS